MGSNQAGKNPDALLLELLQDNDASLEEQSDSPSPRQDVGH